jgi:hypothetical protein
VEDLSVLREGFNSLQKEEILLLRAMTIEESIRQWVELQTAFESQLQQTASLFERDRQAALAELQARLQRLVD